MLKLVTKIMSIVISPITNRLHNKLSDFFGRRRHCMRHLDSVVMFAIGMAMALPNARAQAPGEVWEIVPPATYYCFPGTYGCPAGETHQPLSSIRSWCLGLALNKNDIGVYERVFLRGIEVGYPFLHYNYVCTTKHLPSGKFSTANPPVGAPNGNQLSSFGPWTCPPADPPYLILGRGFCHRTVTTLDPDKGVGDCPVGTCAVSNPINPANGNKYQREVDYTGNGLHPLAMERFYNSASSTNGIWGSKWRGLYDRSIDFPDEAVNATLTRPDGKKLRFRASSSGWLGDPDVKGKLERLLIAPINTNAVQNLGWKYTNESDEVENYDPSGRLTSIVSRAGLTTTLNYDALSRLELVTDAFGRTLRFTYYPSNRVETMTDPAGGIFRYEYDTNNNLSTVTYPDKAVRTYVYGETANTGASLPNHLTGIVDEKSVRFATYKYDDQGRAFLTEHAVGANRYTLGYGSDGKTTVIDPLNTDATKRTLEFQTNVRVARNNKIMGPACPACGPAAQSYDVKGNIVERVGWNGNRSCFAYDEQGRNLEVLRGEGLANSASCPTPANFPTWTPTANTPQRKIATVWHSAFRLPRIVAEPLRRTTYQYNEDAATSCGNKVDGTRVPGALCSKTVQATEDAGGGNSQAMGIGSARVWRYTYNANGQVLTVHSPDVQTTGGVVTPVTTYTYYPADLNDQCTTTTAPGSSFKGCRGQIDTVVDALKKVTKILDYNAHGQPLTIVDPNDLVTKLEYDSRMRLISRNVGGETTLYGYDPVGQLTTVTLASAPGQSGVVEYEYDNAHRLTTIRLKNNGAVVGETTYELDAMGNRKEEHIRVSPTANALQSHFRVYNSLNHLVLDKGGTDPENQVIINGYDNQGNLTSVTFPEGANRIRNYEYDALNRLVKTKDPRTAGQSEQDRGVTEYKYDGLDQLIIVIDPLQHATHYEYDGLNNLKKLTSPDTGITDNMTYDPAGNLLTSTDAKKQTTNYTYDVLGRVKTITYDQASGSQLKTVNYDYDTGPFGNGRLTQVTETAGNNSTLQITDYAYDQHGRLKEEKRTINGVVYVTGYRYDAAGRLDMITYPGGRQVNYALDGLGRVTGVSTTKANVTQTVLNQATHRPFGPVKDFVFGNGQSYSRGYDLDGRITSYSQANQNTIVNYDWAGRIKELVGVNSYKYDELDRLKEVGSASQTFDYDKVGNRIFKM